MKNILLTAGAVVMALAGSAYPQGCAQCQATAQAAAPKQQRALARGIVVLVVPPVAGLCGLLLVARKYRGENR